MSRDGTNDLHDARGGGTGGGTVIDIGRPANDDMLEGYLDGRKDERLEFPDSLSNRSRSYRHGWLNGRDDRVKKPRAAMGVLLREADAAMSADEADSLLSEAKFLRRAP